MKAPLDIIAENLPTYADCYISPREVRLPSLRRLTKDAARIMAALAAEGFEVVRSYDPGQPPQHQWEDRMTDEQAERIASTLERIEGQNETIIHLLRAAHNANQNNLPAGLPRTYIIDGLRIPDPKV